MAFDFIQFVKLLADAAAKASKPAYPPGDAPPVPQPDGRETPEQPPGELPADPLASQQDQPQQPPAPLPKDRQPPAQPQPAEPPKDSPSSMFKVVVPPQPSIPLPPPPQNAAEALGKEGLASLLDSLNQQKQRQESQRGSPPIIEGIKVQGEPQAGDPHLPLPDQKQDDLKTVIERAMQVLLAAIDGLPQKIGEEVRKAFNE